MPFKLLKKSKKSQARLGKLKTAHGTLKTPFFMPIATKAAVKNLTSQDIEKLGSGILLSNTYHLYLTPGMEVMAKAGGLHKFMDWQGAILTDSGGFQVFSLSKIRKILPGGVEFRSHLDGSKHYLTPKKVLEIQKIIGSDIAMILDVCPPSTASHKEVAEAVAMTTKWAKMARGEIKKYRNFKPPLAPPFVKGENNSTDLGNGFLPFTKGEARRGLRQLYFCINQGGIYPDLREKSLKDLAKLDYDGYAVGGLAVGESNEEMYKVLDSLAPQLPAKKPRYLMGVGTPDNIVEAVKRGMDMFDCVIPTREARHGRLYLWKNKSALGASSDFYEAINMTNAKFKTDMSPINDTNLKMFTKAYLHHLFKTGEPLAMRLATLNNLDFYLRLMEQIRKNIKRGKL